MSKGGTFNCAEVRWGMDVYAADGAYQGCIVRVEVRHRDRLVPAARKSVDSIIVGQPWRPWRRRRVSAGEVGNVSMERVVLSDGT